MIITAAPTRITAGPVSQTVNVSDEVSLQCAAVTDQYETLTVEWLRDGVPVNFRTSTYLRLDDHDNSLIIASAAVLDTAQYTCRAGNGLDEVESPPAQLTVRGSTHQGGGAGPDLRGGKLGGWWRGTVVERRSLAGELSLSCARPAADG